MCDFESKRSKAKKVLEEEYFNAYYKAENYFSGPFKNKGAFPSLSYSSTYYNPFLQIADLIVGCMAELVRNWIKNEEVKKFTKDIFNILKKSLVKKPNTSEIFRYGIISKPENFQNFLNNRGLL